MKRITEHEKFKGVPGVYCLGIGNYTWLYVGKAQCLYKRVAFHLKRRSDVQEVLCFDYSNELEGLSLREANSYLSWLEANIIEMADPIENIQRPKPDPFKLPFKVLGRLINKLPDVG